MTSKEKLVNRLNKNLHICVGLDTDINKIPKHLLKEKEPILEFNKIVIENTYEHAAAYKINFAFYESLGEKGFEIISKTIELIPTDIFTVADAKRGDIGNTSEMYAKAIYDELNFDSITLHPYMGFDSLSPFLAYKDKVNFILALTSNKGSVDFEKLKTSDGKLIFQKVIEKVNDWNNENNCGIVFGATNIQELLDNINSFENLFVLLPGVGAQGGSLSEVVTTFKNASNNNYLINISRALLYKSSSNDFGNIILSQMIDYNSEVKKILI